jgi:hypothetical protein
MRFGEPLDRDLSFAALQQVFALVVASLVLDMGQFLSATIYASFVFWIAVAMIAVRRWSTRTLGDRRFIRYGLCTILSLCIPAFYVAWAIKKVI